MNDWADVQTATTWLPKKFAFNFEIGIDCLEFKGAHAKRYTFRYIVDQGKSFQRVELVRSAGVASPP